MALLTEEPETGAAEWNPIIVNLIIHTCDFTTSEKPYTPIFIVIKEHAQCSNALISGGH